MTLTKVLIEYKFSLKRNLNLTTPCCGKNNKDGKFSTYIGLPEIYGYCHSCGATSLPYTIYKDEKGNEYIWNEVLKRYEPIGTSFHTISSYPVRNEEKKVSIEKQKKYIDESVIWTYFNHTPENNLLTYLRNTYGDKKVQDAKEYYAIGTTKDGGTVFWTINKDLKVQKAKVSYYNENGKRTDKFKVPYKNADGYFTCLFGEHFLSYECYQNSTVILVESEKTAIVGYILMPQYVWLAYGGCNGLTTEKTTLLKDFRVLLVPDLSENAVAVATKKILELRQKGIDIKLWDMTDGKTDEELKLDGVHNCDLEDFFRQIKND